VYLVITEVKAKLTYVLLNKEGDSVEYNLFNLLIIFIVKLLIILSAYLEHHTCVYVFYLPVSMQYKAI